ncbi:hypothetical protein SDRG_10524 [Saprolegnia diclina VS20]|uniref:PX domain-containing protein n=1 Tax=Saprolegnia diclina (strain VS20) TaxID=1156394 RepID=T0RHE1_SAPDV|nr:hypothetical protein SDRG_10524 [Saprolegnia diclina VS20]EQC31733.1 hypothetical protein SDRG_10524 [Saprolegnia diclina VS20]|eukprot:XP_008614740.1 hypothetical protein SDRG_10524 [Saprolegnia diclina VS20]
MNIITLQQWLLFEADIALYLAAGLSFSIVSGFLSWCLLATRCFHSSKHLDTMIEDHTFAPLVKGNSLSLHDSQVLVTQVQLLDNDDESCTHASYTITLTWGAKLEASHTKLLRKRYSEFAQLITAIKSEIKEMEDRPVVPVLPSKSLLRQLNPAFLEKRRLGLQLFLHQVASNPKLADLPAVRQFVGLH